jgi:hypothetical protein
MSSSQKAVVKEFQNFGTKELPFEAPYGYFENLPNRVWGKIPQSRPVSIWMQPVFRLGLAGFSALILATFVWWPTNNAHQTQKELNQLATTEIADYLLAHSDPQGMVLLAQVEPINWEEILPWQDDLNVEEVLPWVDESDIIAAWEEI